MTRFYIEAEYDDQYDDEEYTSHQVASRLRQFGFTNVFVEPIEAPGAAGDV